MNRLGRLLVVLALVGSGTALAFAGAAPDPYRTVSQVVHDADAGDHVQVKATVQAGSVNLTDDGASFLLTDERNDLRVRMDGPLPDHRAGGSLDGRTVVASGTLVLEDGHLVLRGGDLQVGCASKYAPDGRA